MLYTICYLDNYYLNTSSLYSCLIHYYILLLVATAYELWLQYEVRTDDITIIILGLNTTNDATSTEPANFTRMRSSPHLSEPMKACPERDSGRSNPDVEILGQYGTHTLQKKDSITGM
jgi:hypothetical protein